MGTIFLVPISSCIYLFCVCCSRVGEECEVYFPSLSRAMDVAMEYVFPLGRVGVWQELYFR